MVKYIYCEHFGRSVLTPLHINSVLVLFEFVEKNSMQKLKFNGNSEAFSKSQNFVQENLNLFPTM